MHAVVITVYVADPHDEMGWKNLRDNVAPGVARAPGFVAGYWLEPTAGNEALSVVLFETEDFAKAGLDMAKEMFAGSEPPPGVRLKTAEVRAVAANA